MLLMYDIESDKIREKVSEACLDYGLERIQFSAFFGRLTRDKRQELALRVGRLVQDENARVRMMPLTEEALGEMWEYDHWRLDADELKEAAEKREVVEMPKLKIVRLKEE